MGSSKKVTIGYWYFMDVLTTLCHAGPTDEVSLVELQFGERTAWTGSVSSSQTIPINNLMLFGGEEREGGVQGNVDVMMGESSMSVNSFLGASVRASGITGPVPAYRGVLSLFFRGGATDAEFTPSPEFSRILLTKPFTILGITSFTSYIPPAFRWAAINPYFKKFRARVRRYSGWYPSKNKIGVYANPAHIIYECLTNSEWGMGYPEGDIDLTRMQAFADALHAEGFGLGLMWYAQGPIEEFILNINQHISASLLEDRSTGQIFPKLIRGDYDPDTLIELNLSNCELREYKRAGIGEVINEVTIRYRKADGKWDSVTVQDLAGVVSQGQTINHTIDMPGIRTAELALRVAQRELQARVKPLSQVSLVASSVAYPLYPGDVFKLSWPAEGIQSVIYRIIDMSMGRLEDNTIRIEAIEDVFGMPSSSYTAPQTSGWVDTNQDPVAASIQVTREASYPEVLAQVSDADREFLPATFGYGVMLAAKPQSDTSRYTLNYSSNNTSYGQVASAGWTPTALLSAGVGRLTTTLPITSSIDFYKLLPGMLGYLGNELVQIDLTEDFSDPSQIKVKRGCVDTVPAEHGAGTRLWFFDESLVGLDPEVRVSGETAWYKAQTVTSRGELAIGSATGVSLAFNNRFARPYPPGNFRINGASHPSTFTGELSVQWSHRDRVQQADQIIDYSVGDIGPEAGTTYNLRIYGEDGTTLLRTATGLTGTSYHYPELEEIADSLLEDPSITDTYEDAVLASVPVGYWKLDEVAGSAMVDSSGNGHNGTFNGSYTLGQAPAVVGGHAVAFAAGGTHNASVPHNAAFNAGLGEWAFECFLKWTGTAPAHTFARFVASSPFIGPQVVVNMSESLGTHPGGVSVRDREGVAYTLQSTATGMNDGQYRHFVFQRRLVSTGPDVWKYQIYIDKVLDAEKTVTVLTNLTGTVPTYLMGHPSYTGLSGTMDEAAFYVGKSLSASEVAAHYDARFSGARLNNSLRIELESERDGLVSHQLHNHTAERV